MTTQAAVDTFLQEAMATYGEAVTVLPYTTSATASVYRQRTKAFGAPVEVVGAVAFGLTQEQATAIGLNSVPKGTVTFARKDLEDAYSTTDLSETVKASDDLVIKGERFRITECSTSGRIENAPTFIVAAFEYHRGREGEEYP